MQENTFSVVVLAAGKGSRLNMGPKPLVEINGTPLIAPIIDKISNLPFVERLIVISKHTAAISERFTYEKLSFIDTDTLGTGHALASALPFVSTSHVLMVQADDSFLLSSATIERMLSQHLETNATVTMCLAHMEREANYTWVEHHDGIFEAIHSSTDDMQLPPPKDIAAGIYVFKTEWVEEALTHVPYGETTGEKPLPGVLKIAKAEGTPVHVCVFPGSEWLGVNTPAELEQASQLIASL